MKVLFVFTASALLALCAAQDEIGLKAPSNQINCGCQCDSYTWVDPQGNIQGNCKSPDKTGGRWCYTLSRSCQDLQFSKNRVDNHGHKRGWSYEACATPPLGSPQCSGGHGGPSGGGQPNVNLIALLGTRDATNVDAAPAAPAADGSVTFEQ